MSQKSPLVSVYIPTKNRRELLSNAIDSILKQTYSNVEIIVVDDGSSDGTFEFLEKLMKTTKNLQIFRNETSIGACASRNIAIKNARGTFISGLDDDDVFLSNRIESLVAAYNEKFAFVCSSMLWDYGRNKRLIDFVPGEISLEQQLSYNEATSQVLVEKERVLSVGGFDENLVSCQDYDLWTRLIFRYGNAYRISAPSYIINDTGSSVRMIRGKNSVKGYYQFLKKHKHLMNSANLKNQKFMRLRRRLDVMTLSELFNQLGSGKINSKIRYFLSSNFTFIRNARDNFNKNKPS
jgi:glycosyltransferase involved in cell wall biosynthesis